MIANLPRELLWTDKTNLSDFMSDKLGNGVISIFSFAKARITINLSAEAMLMLYNEAFYLSTRVVYEHDAEAQPEAYIKLALADLEDKELADHVICLMFMVLMLQSDKSKEVLQFTDKLQKEQLSQMPFHIMNWFNKVFKPGKNRVDFLLQPCPYSPDRLQNISLDWHKITKGFSQNIIVELLDLWDSEVEKGKVIRLIENASNSYQQVSANQGLAGKADDEFFTKQKNLYHVTNDDKEECSSKDESLVALSVDQIFKYDNTFVRNAVKCIVEKFYRGHAVNLALIEIVLSDHEQLKDKKRTCHKPFVKILKEWGALSQDLDVKRTANGMSQKIRKINILEGTPDKHYLEWRKCLRDRQKCISIGDELSKLLEYSE